MASVASAASQSCKSTCRNVIDDETAKVKKKAEIEFALIGAVSGGIITALLIFIILKRRKFPTTLSDFFKALKQLFSTPQPGTGPRWDFAKLKQISATLHNHAFTIVFTLLLVILFAYYHVVFFADVISKDGLDTVHNYIQNAEKLDRNIGRIVQDAKKLCTDDQTAGATSFVAFIKDKSMIGYFAAVGFLLVLAIINLVFQRQFVDKMRWMIMPSELGSLGLLFLPILVNTLLYSCVYSKVKFFSNIQLTELIKNVRLCNDMQTLYDTFQTSQVDIKAAKSSDGSCLNCLDDVQRQDYITDLKADLNQYTSMVSQAKTQMSSIAGDRQYFLLLTAAFALSISVMLCLYWARVIGYNDSGTLVSIFVSLALFALFLSLFLPFIIDKQNTQAVSVNNIVRLLCSGL